MRVANAREILRSIVMAPVSFGKGVAWMFLTSLVMTAKNGSKQKAWPDKIWNEENIRPVPFAFGGFCAMIPSWTTLIAGGVIFGIPRLFKIK